MDFKILDLHIFDSSSVKAALDVKQSVVLVYTIAHKFIFWNDFLVHLQ